MKELARALDIAIKQDDPVQIDLLKQGAREDRLREAASDWAAYCLKAHHGDLIGIGLKISESIAHYCNWIELNSNPTDEAQS